MAPDLEKSDKWSLFAAGLLVGMFLIILMYDLRRQKPVDYVDRAVEAGFAHYGERDSVVWDDQRARYVVTGEGSVEGGKR